jgi:SNF2 family DNA or RNA helicase
MLGLKYPNFLFFLDMGLGKTKIILDILRYRIYGAYIDLGLELGSKTINHIDKVSVNRGALILVPNVVNINNWVMECSIHTPSIMKCPLYGSSVERWAILENRAGFSSLFILNYAGLVNMVCNRDKKKGGLVVNKGKLDEFLTYFDAVVFDESQSIKNHRSLTYQICKRIATHCKVKYAMTGTPFGRDPSDLWTQFYVIDNGDTLGYTLSIFRQGFFRESINYWGGYEYIFNKKKEKLLSSFLKNRSIRYNENECRTLPDKVYTKQIVTLPPEVVPYYQQVIADVAECEGDYTLLNNIFVKLRQFTSGFMTIKTEEDGRDYVDFPTNPKIEALVQTLSEVPSSSKVVIFHEYIHTGDLIEQALKKNKIKFSKLWGGTKDKVGAIEKFVNEEKCKVLLSNSKSGAIGLNLQVANYVIFFESPVSPIIRSQAEKRCHRTGQKKKVFYIDIIMEKSIDIKILRYLKEGEDLFKALIDGREYWGGLFGDEV